MEAVVVFFNLAREWAILLLETTVCCIAEVLLLLLPGWGILLILVGAIIGCLKWKRKRTRALVALGGLMVVWVYLTAFATILRLTGDPDPLGKTFWLVVVAAGVQAGTGLFAWMFFTGFHSRGRPLPGAM